MIQYTDFECPFCSTAANKVLPQLRHEYFDSGKVALIFKHFPLEIHRDAMGASIAAQCAAEQGTFWPFHDALFADITKLGNSDLRGRALELALDMSRFDACSKGPAAAARIEADKAEAAALSLTATPTFMLGKMGPEGVRVVEVITGVKKVQTFKSALDKLLRE